MDAQAAARGAMLERLVAVVLCRVADEVLRLANSCGARSLAQPAPPPAWLKHGSNAAIAKRHARHACMRV
eukprot:366568-Chlamydomonas_euryale.AAC.8